MIPVSIESLIVGFAPAPSVIALRPNDKEDDSSGTDRVLPIWIGPMEASAIGAALDGTPSLRPLTHDLANSLLKAVGATVSRVVIDRVEGTTFYATVHLRCPNGMFTRVDARPSDAIALAIRADAPLFVEDAVMEAASYPRSFKDGSDTKIEMEEFHKFIEAVNPEDFVSNGTSGKS